MIRFPTRAIWLLAIGCFSLSCRAATAQVANRMDARSIDVKGVCFIPNHGQWSDSGVIYGFSSPGLDIAFRESALTMHVRESVKESGPPGSLAEPVGTMLVVTFPQSNRVLPDGAVPQHARLNYCFGDEERGSATNVPTWGEVVYQDLYDGVSLHITSSNDGILKYEFHVAPGADYSPICLSVSGSDSLCVANSGDVHISTASGVLRDLAPRAWQESNDHRDYVPAHFELLDDQTYRITLTGPVDPSREIIIDPDVAWMTYLGGTSSDEAHDVAVSSDGFIYVTGETDSIDFEERRNTPWGGTDAFVLKLDSSGAVRWMTYLGGRNADSGRAIAVDAAGQVWIAGQTASPDFADRNNAYHGGISDAFIARLEPNGVPAGMWYLGGGGGEIAFDAALDNDGHVFLAGATDSHDFEGRLNASHEQLEAFVVRASTADGAVEWMRYVGGDGIDRALGLALNGVGEPFVSGETSSINFDGAINEHHGGAFDGFVARLNSSGDLLWTRYLGGAGWERGGFIAIDAADNLLVTGGSSSLDFEGAANENHGSFDAYVAKVSPPGSLLWSIYIGGADVDDGRAVSIDPPGDAMITGQTESWDFEGQNNTYHLGESDAFAARVSSTGLQTAMSFLGGRGSDDGRGLAVSGTHEAIVIGTTQSLDFEGRLNGRHGSLDDAFALSVRLQGPVLGVVSSCPSGGPIEVSWSGATPDAPVALVFGEDGHLFRIPPSFACANTLLNVGGHRIRVVYSGSAGSDGSRTLHSMTGAGVCGQSLQLLELPACRKSNVARIQ